MKKKFIDEKGRFFGIVSIIDIIVVVVLIVLAAAVYVRFFANRDTIAAADGSTFTYEIRVRGETQEIADSIKVGDQLYDLENEYFIGTVTEVSTEAAMQQTPLADGTYVNAPVENRVDITVQVETDGLVSNDRYYAGRSYEVCVNDSLSFFSKYVSTTGVIWSIN